MTGPQGPVGPQNILDYAYIYNNQELTIPSIGIIDFMGNKCRAKEVSGKWIVYEKFA
jgi:hypothetical protein